MTEKDDNQAIIDWPRQWAKSKTKLMDDDIETESYINRYSVLYSFLSKVWNNGNN